MDFDELAQELDRANIRYQRHRNHFDPWTDDQVLLQYIGKKRWVLLTSDQRQKTKRVENHQIRQYKVRSFVLTSGEMGKSAICVAVMKAKNKMRQICRDNPGPFIGSISKSGKVELHLLPS